MGSACLFENFAPVQLCAYKIKPQKTDFRFVEDVWHDNKFEKREKYVPPFIGAAKIGLECVSLRQINRWLKKGVTPAGSQNKYWTLFPNLPALIFAGRPFNDIRKRENV